MDVDILMNPFEFDAQFVFFYSWLPLHGGQKPPVI